MFSSLWKMTTLGAGILFALTAAWALRLDYLRRDWADKADRLTKQDNIVLVATQLATGKPNLAWSAVPLQITALGASNIGLKSSIEAANGKVDNLSAETKRLASAGDGLRSELAAAQSERAVFAGRLDSMAQQPGDHQSCPALLSQTQDALDLAWSSGQ